MNKSAKEKKRGELYVLLNCFLWAFFPVITVLSFGKLPSLISLAWSTLFSTVFFFIVLLFRNKWHEIQNPELWKYTFSIVLFVGVLFYGFYFIGLTKTTPGNAGIITLFDIFVSFLFFSIVKKEPFSLEHVIGSILMVAGAVIILVPGFKGINTGDLFIFIATFFPTF